MAEKTTGLGDLPDQSPTKLALLIKPQGRELRRPSDAHAVLLGADEVMQETDSESLTLAGDSPR